MICVILGVLVGIFASDYIDWYKAIAEYYPDAVATIGGQETVVTYSDIPRLIMYFLSTDSEYMGGTIKNVLMGLLFAFLGVFTILRNAGKQAKAAKQAEEQTDGSNL